MPVNIYKYLFKDPDCDKIVPSDLQLGTYTNKKVNILGFCNLYIIHPDTRCTMEVTIFVASNEGSILISCATSPTLGLIKPHDSLDCLLPEGNVISSSADKIKDETQLKVCMLVRKPKLKSSNEEVPIVCSSDEHSKSNKEFVTICSKEPSNTTDTRNTGDKNCQADKSDMQPVKPTMDMWSNRPAVPIQYEKSKIVPQQDDNNCQANILPVKLKVCSDKKCQEILNVQMRPGKPISHMQSVTNDMQLPKPAVQYK